MSEECVICRFYENDPEGKEVVVHTKIENIMPILHYATDRLSCGESKFKPLVEYMDSLTDEQLNTVKYHSHGRKKIVNSTKLDRATKRKNDELNTECAGGSQKGRPAKLKSSNRNPRLPSHAPKAQVCVFAPCQWEHTELSKVVTDPRGQQLLDIKNFTTDDKIRTALSTLTGASDAKAQELWYHKNCIVYAERTCKSDNSDGHRRQEIHRKLADLELLVFVKSSLATGAVLNMKTLNKDYIDLRSEHGATEISDNYKKYIKKIISDKVENVSFIAPPRRNESEQVIQKSIISDAVDYMIEEQSSNWDVDLVRVSKMLRRELLDNYGSWSFTGSVSTNINKIPMLKFFLRQLLFGPGAMTHCGTRDIEIDQTIDIMMQMMLSNVRTDRQMKWKPKADTGFRKNSQTPLSVGLPLTIHKKVRSKGLINVLADMKIGVSYNSIINIEKRIEAAVIDQMKISGGYCLPSFIKKDRCPFFAIDNIDFQEDTAYGQDTLHGTVVVVNQHADDSAEKLVGPLKIPDKIAKCRIDVKYQEEPIMKSIPMKFQHYFCSVDGILQDYKLRDITWALANYLANDVNLT